MIRLGIALDSSTIRVGLVDDAAVRVLHEEPMPTEGGRDASLECICSLIDRLPIVDAASIGVSMSAGSTQFTEKNGTAAIGTDLEAKYDVPTFVKDAAHCFAIAESRYGGGRGQSPMVGIRVGHQLDGGIVVGGRLLAGQADRAGQFGRASYRNGTYNDYCTARFLTRHHEATAADVIEQAEAGDADAVALLNEMGTHLGQALRSVCCTVDPACIVIGGGLAHAHPFFEDAMRAALASGDGPVTLDSLLLHRSSLRHVEVLGAAALGIVREQTPDRSV